MKVTYTEVSVDVLALLKKPLKQQISANTMKSNRLYIICPGSVSGDLWHLAAAQILHTEYGKAGILAHHKIVPVVAVSKERAGKEHEKEEHEEKEHEKEEHEEKEHEEYVQGRVTYNYLTQIGLEAVVAVADQTAADKNNIEWVMYNQEAAKLDELYQAQYSQTRDTSWNFDKAWETAMKTPVVTECKLLGSHEQSYPPRFPADGQRIVRLMVATTIAIGYLYPKNTRAERLSLLSARMSKLSAPSDSEEYEVQRKAEQKVEELKNFVSVGKKMIFESYRFNKVNE